jgi:hypothetical protein
MKYLWVQISREITKINTNSYHLNIKSSVFWEISGVNCTHWPLHTSATGLLPPLDEMLESLNESVKLLRWRSQRVVVVWFCHLVASNQRKELRWSVMLDLVASSRQIRGEDRSTHRPKNNCFVFTLIFICFYVIFIQPQLQVHLKN